MCNSHVRLIAMNPIMRLSLLSHLLRLHKSNPRTHTVTAPLLTFSSALETDSFNKTTTRQQQDNNKTTSLSCYRSRGQRLYDKIRHFGTHLLPHSLPLLLCLVFDNNCLRSRFHSPCTGKKKNEGWLFRQRGWHVAPASSTNCSFASADGRTLR